MAEIDDVIRLSAAARYTRALLDQIASAMGKTIDDIDFVGAAEADTGETDDTEDH